MWVARDKCGVACLYNTKPTRDEENGSWFVAEDTWIGDNPAWEYLQILEQFDTIPDLKWEDEPVEVEIAKSKRCTCISCGESFIYHDNDIIHYTCL